MTTCVSFPGAKTAGGYGLKWSGGKLRLAHRLAYAESRDVGIGSLDGFVVKHSCDNPSCINPTHLSLGSQADNTQERSVRAGRHCKLKLLPNQVLEIKLLAPSKGVYAAAIKLAEQYNVNESTIRKIWSGKYWSHL